MLSEIKSALRALQAGEQLSNPEVWKVRQNAVNAVASILGFVAVVLPMIGVQIELSAEDIITIAGGIATIGGLWNGYFTVATTNKIGMSNEPVAESDGNPDVIGEHDKQQENDIRYNQAEP